MPRQGGSGRENTVRRRYSIATWTCDGVCVKRVFKGIAMAVHLSSLYKDHDGMVLSLPCRDGQIKLNEQWEMRMCGVVVVCEFCGLGAAIFTRAMS